MTLKERFIKPTKKYSSASGWCIDLESAEECVEIADNHAISFYEWRITTSIKNIDQYTNKETLEIYKKEKGL